MQYKGNKKQYELNAQLDEVLDRIKEENSGANDAIEKMANEGKSLLKKRQKLIRIADKSSDGWKVVDEYISDELASNSEDEKRLKKAKETVARRKRFSRQPQRATEAKKFKSAQGDAEQRYFRGPNPLDNGFCKNILEAAKRSREVPIKKKKPLSSTMLKQIIDRPVN
ncbi:hypothetical protein QZH41_006332 [Actinostola sp. cb2023]|nr:hypothetical protein QZH41_006332 [Actinostola sp. cb2023]